jgi:hypothetical protein
LTGVDNVPEAIRENTTYHDSKGRFAPGNPGKPKGTLNKAPSRYALQCAEHAPLAFQVLHDRLVAGDLKAALFVLQRVLPSERLIELPSSDPSAWADAMADGLVSPTEAAKAASALNTLASAAEVKDLMARLDELEHRFGLGGSGRQ